MVKVSREQINKDEKKILAELQKDAQKGIDMLAKRCGFSRQKVWRIVKRLEKNRMIWGYTAIVD
jgi:DNA-binding Lrp family transcriptional regulator